MFIKHEVKNKPSFYCEIQGRLVPFQIKDNELFYQRMGMVENTEVNSWMLRSKTTSTMVSSDKKTISFKSMPKEKLNFECPDKNFTKIPSLVARLNKAFNVNIRAISVHYCEPDNDSKGKFFVIIKVIAPDVESKEKIKKGLIKTGIKEEFVYDVYDDLHFLIEEK